MLLIVCFRTWPASYGTFAAASIGAAVISSNLDSLERYALAAFPLILVVAALTRRPAGRARGARALGIAAMTVYALLAFFHAYVP